MLLCITMQKRNILIVSIVLVGVIGMAGFVGNFNSIIMILLTEKLLERLLK